MAAAIVAIDQLEVANQSEPAARDSEPQGSTGTPVRRTGGFAGFSWGQLFLGAVLMGFVVWGFWMMQQIEKISDRRIVAVSLSGMVNDFIATEARSGNGPEQVEADTKRFMMLMQQVLSERAALGETVIVGEAIVAGSAPDITPQIRQEVGKRMIAGIGGGRTRQVPPSAQIVPQAAPAIQPLPQAGGDPAFGQ